MTHEFKKIAAILAAAACLGAVSGNLYLAHDRAAADQYALWVSQ